MIGVCSREYHLAALGTEANSFFSEAMQRGLSGRFALLW
jgi:hypothetical protein